MIALAIALAVVAVLQIACYRRITHVDRTLNGGVDELARELETLRGAK